MPTENKPFMPVIGLEIHAELKTASKMFCSCKNDPDEGRPNANVCPVCLGHPGTLPILNRQAIEHVLRVGASVSGEIADFTEWDRKNYFYPDIPKGYQLSQYKYPLVTGGSLAGIELERIHLEEDTARSTHDQHEKSLVDFNRSGVPLMELVTKPVIHDAETAVRFARELQLLLRYLGAGEANLEKGEMRIEANVSVGVLEADERSSPDKEARCSISNPSDGFRRVASLSGELLSSASIILGTKTEVKNLNSFRAVERAIEYEIARQTSLLEDGGKVVQETRGWDDARGETYSQRSKESSHDYRYFPDPDIPKMKISEIPEFSADTLRDSLPELPWQARDRFKGVYGMTDKEVAVMVEEPVLAEYYGSILDAGRFTDKPDDLRVKLTVNYLLSDYLGLISANKYILRDILIRRDAAFISPAAFAELVSMVASGDISSRGAKDLMAILFKEKNPSTASPRSLAEKHGLMQKSDTASLEPAIDKVIADNAKVVAEYRGGKTVSLQFLIGQAMKATRGAGNPAVVKEILVKKLS
ncbi:MAG: Asp-tRNA(Asn)/Glu-tRNA(Gln) amidotransferase subunit GatB [Patescibacteria group bacterium]|nr:Asp-tRNA(Asn)/Glu-tRNA(Gln) amidotransferase subunit GatB [Patescibacteria group bacterium]